MFNFPIPISLLPFYAIALLSLGDIVASVNYRDTASPEIKSYIQKYHLTPEQIQSLSQIQNQYAKQLQQLNQELKQDEKELTEMMMGEASPEEISIKYDRLQILKQQAAQLYLKKFLAIRQVLTIDQRRQFGEAFSSSLR